MGEKGKPRIRGRVTLRRGLVEVWPGETHEGHGTLGVLVANLPRVLIVVALLALLAPCDMYKYGEVIGWYCGQLALNTMTVCQVKLSHKGE